MDEEETVDAMICIDCLEKESPDVDVPEGIQDEDPGIYSGGAGWNHSGHLRPSVAQ